MTKEEKRFRKMQEAAIEAKKKRINALMEEELASKLLERQKNEKLDQTVKEAEDARALCNTPDCIKPLPCCDHMEDTEPKKPETVNNSFDEKMGTPMSPVSGDDEDEENEKDPLIDQD